MSGIVTRPAPGRTARLAVVAAGTALALLTSGLGGAEAADTSDSAMPSIENVVLRGCTKPEGLVIHDSFRTAELQIEAVLEAFRTDSVPAKHYATWFGDADPRIVVAAYQAIDQRMDSGVPMRIDCNHREDCADKPFAYAYPGSSWIGFCQRFFDAHHEGIDSQPGVVVHEMSHLSSGTDDVQMASGDTAYGVTAARQLARESPKLAARNADSFEYFVETYPGLMLAPLGGRLVSR